MLKSPDNEVKRCLVTAVLELPRIAGVKVAERHERAVLDFLDSLPKIFPLDILIVQKFGELRAKLKKEGNVAEDIDWF